MPRTPGQLVQAKCGNVITSGNNWIAHIERGPNVNDDFALLAAAWNSYDRNCGDRAQECAESDLLGQLLILTVMTVEQHQKEHGICLCVFCRQAAPLIAIAY